jgi:hypothetical protein
MTFWGGQNKVLRRVKAAPATNIANKPFAHGGEGRVLEEGGVIEKWATATT